MILSSNFHACVPALELDDVRSGLEVLGRAAGRATPSRARSRGRRPRSAGRRRAACRAPGNSDPSPREESSCSDNLSPETPAMARADFPFAERHGDAVGAPLRCQVGNSCLCRFEDLRERRGPIGPTARSPPSRLPRRRRPEPRGSGSSGRAAPHRLGAVVVTASVSACIRSPRTRAWISGASAAARRHSVSSRTSGGILQRMGADQLPDARTGSGLGSSSAIRSTRACSPAAGEPEEEVLLRGESSGRGSVPRRRRPRRSRPP